MLRASVIGRMGAFAFLLALLVVGISSPAAHADDPTGITKKIGGKVACNLLPDPLLRSLCQSPAGQDAAGKAAGSVADKAGDVVTAPIKGIGNSVIEGIASSIAASASEALGKMSGYIDSVTSPDLNADWFLPQYNMVLGLSMALMLLFMLVSAVSATIRQRVGELARISLVYPIIAGVMCFLAPTFTMILVNLSDQMTLSFTKHTGDQAGKFMSQFAKTLADVASHTGDFGSALFMVMMFAFVILLGGIVIMLELILREGAIYISVMLLPLVFSAMVSERVGWAMCKKVIYFLLFLIFVKPVIAMVMSLGMAMVSQSDQGGISALLLGTTAIVIAAFCPMAIFKFIPAIEAHTKGVFGAPSRSASGTMRQSAASGTKLLTGLMSKQGAAGGSAMTAGTAGAAGAATFGVGAAVVGGASAAKKGARHFGNQAYSMFKQGAGESPSGQQTSTARSPAFAHASRTSPSAEPRSHVPASRVQPTVRQPATSTGTNLMASKPPSTLPKE